MSISASRAPVGIRGFDEITGGGLPAGRSVLIIGDPGSGSTIFAAQFLWSGITKFGENGLLVSLFQNRSGWDLEMKEFGWDFGFAEKKGKFSFVDASPTRGIPGEVKIGKLTIGRQDFSLLSLLELVRNNARSIDAKRIVLDPVSMLTFQYPGETQRRKVMLDLVETLAGTGATCLLLSELRRVGLRGRTVQAEESWVQGVVLMQTIAAGRTMERTVTVERMRGTQIDRHPRPYRITETGIEVYAREAFI